MNEQQPTVAHWAIMHAKSYASRNDGTGKGDSFEWIIRVEFRSVPLDEWRGIGNTDDAAGHCRDWVARYLDGVDLTGGFDFAPTLDRMTVYLFRVFETLAPELLASVMVVLGEDSCIVHAAQAADE